MHSSVLEVLLCIDAPDILYGTFVQSRESGLDSVLEHLKAVEPGERVFYKMKLLANSTSSHYKSILQQYHKLIGPGFREAKTVAIQRGQACDVYAEIHESVDTVTALSGELNPLRLVMLQESFSHVHLIRKEYPDAFMVLIGNELLISLPKKGVSKDRIIASIDYALQTGTGSHNYKVSRDSFRSNDKQFDFAGLTFWAIGKQPKCRPSNKSVADLDRILRESRDIPALGCYYYENFLRYFRGSEVKNIMKKIKKWERSL